MTKEMETQLCIRCGELVPQGCCTCGDKQELAPLGFPDYLQIAVENFNASDNCAADYEDREIYVKEAIAAALIGLLQELRREK